ncbi:MAG: zinc dependent phospholipase C family protein [Bdellovibrionia bacterium]
MNLLNRFTPILLLIALLAVFTVRGRAYSVLTHEQIVDLLWKDQIQPLLLKRFPGTTDDQMREAHAYAYGGSVIQDMGYYPFGSKYFSDLVHYVRSGDFVEALIRNSSDLNEYAFALGALAHYTADNSGHPMINQVVAIEFPKLKKKYGDKVTYADDPKAHIRTEFGFDVEQVAKNRYTSDRYHDFIGFEVAKPLMQRSFEETYGIKLDEVFGDLDLAIGTFRRSISKVLPEMTRVALISRKDEIVRETPNFDKKKFLYYLSRTGYEKEWGKGYRRPGFGTRILAFILKAIPKFGPFSALNFKIPSTKTEDMYIKSVDATVQDYAHRLRQVKQNGDLDLPNLDCDTGEKAKAGEYRLADKTFAKLVDDLANQAPAQIDPDLQSELAQFYAGATIASEKKDDKKSREKTLQELDKLGLKLRSDVLDFPSFPGTVCGSE